MSRSTQTLTRDEARRLAVRAALLAEERPADLGDTATRLTMLPLDQTRAVAPAAELVLWSRLGDEYRPGELDDAIAAQEIVEIAGAFRPVEDAALFRAEMAAWPTPGVWKDWHHRLHDWIEANAAARLDVLELLRQEGPLPVSALPDTCVEPWRSSGWNDGKNTRMLVSQLVQRGEVAVAGRDGTTRTYDLAERVYADDPVPPLDEAQAELDSRRLRAFGIARAGDVYQQGEPVGSGAAGVEVSVEGVRGRWRADSEALTSVDQPVPERVTLLAPFDVLLHDRKRMTDLLGFDYALEMYKPPAKRRWGYYALPVLYGDRLVGKVDAKAEPDAGELLLHAIHEDVPFDPDLRSAVDRQVDSLASVLKLTVVESPHDP